MQVLVATHETQGWRANDSCWAIEGELVLLVPSECSRGSVDDECGCRRAFAGAVSHRATTTMKVVERTDLDGAAYFVLIADALESQGYVNERLLRDQAVRRWIAELCEDLIRMAAAYPPGTVLERRGDVVRSRPGSRSEL